MSKAKLMQWSLRAGGLYFFMVAAAHMMGLKLPLLFVYYNVPSYAYQDRIISFLAFGWAVFLLSASDDPAGERRLVRAVLVAGGGAVAGLVVINLTTDFAALGPAILPRNFWLETVALLAYWLWLIACSRGLRKG